MFIREMEGYDNRYCECCGKFKTNKDIEDKHLTKTIFGVFVGSVYLPDFMLCRDCLRKLYEGIKKQLEE